MKIAFSIATTTLPSIHACGFRFECAMLKELLFARTQIPLLARGLDALDLRHKAIARNIANTQSSGYKRELVNFEAELRGALGRKRGGEIFRTHPDHLPLNQLESGVGPTLRTANDRVDGPGAEAVVIEREMVDLAQNQLKYEAEVRLARQHFEMLKMAIRGMA